MAEQINALKRKIILDTDPGIDDAMAILLAARNPRIELVGITTVAGNCAIEKVTLNALQICELAGLTDVPVAKGASLPLVREPVVADYVHGDTGIGGLELPYPSKTVVAEHAVDFIIRKLLESEGDITLVPIGPLTNIAIAIRKEPQIITKIHEVVIMGGGSFGNITPAAEFNFYADAEAARAVFDSGLPITMIGLDLTHQAVATEEVKERLSSLGNQMSSLVMDLISFYELDYIKRGLSGAAVHDPCCIAYCIDPSMFTTKHLRVDIETKAEFTYGMSMIDTYRVTGREPNANVALALDAGKFWSTLIEAIQQYE